MCSPGPVEYDPSAAFDVWAEDDRDELKDAVTEATTTGRGLLVADTERIRIRAAETILNSGEVSKATWITSHQAENDSGGRGGGGELLDDLLYHRRARLRPPDICNDADRRGVSHPVEGVIPAYTNDRTITVTSR